MFGHNATHHRQAYTNLLAGITVYGTVMLIYTLAPYYQHFISREHIDLTGAPPFLKEGVLFLLFVFGNNPGDIIWRLYVLYCLVAGLRTVYYLARKKTTVLQPNRPALFLLALQRGIRETGKLLQSFISGQKAHRSVFTPEDRTSLLFMLVKFFYIPIMFNFLFLNLGNLSYNLNQISQPSDFDSTLRSFYLFAMSLLFLIDVGYFCFGYLIESTKLKNVVRSVEPTFLGWSAALLCYPPFNAIPEMYLGWGSTDYSTFGNTPMTMLFLGLSFVCMLVYVWASVSLGAKCSNLTNRGVVTTGAYAYVRHPAYISKNLSWLIMGLPLIDFEWRWSTLNIFSQSIHVPVLTAHWSFLISILAWAFIYFVRAITEERHLMQDKEYQHYCQKVPYRFIPGLY